MREGETREGETREGEREREIQYVQIKLQNVRVTIFLPLFTHVHLVLLFLRISPSHQVDGLCMFLSLVAAPRLAPEPFLR